MELIWYFLKIKDNSYSTYGFGITAWSEKDAVNLLKEKVFKNVDLPKIIETKIITSLDDLEQNHVKPNIGNPVFRGVWYPNFT